MTWTTRPRSEFGPLRGIRAGAGPSVVLLHGVGLRAEAWAAAMDALGSEYHLTAFDLPGHGASPPLPKTAGLCDFTDAVAAAMDGPAVVVGHSMGAMIALDLAVRHSGLVQGVAALSAIFQRTCDAAQAVQARASALDGKTPVDPTITLQRWFGHATTAEAQACRGWLSTVDPAAYKQAYTIFAHADGPDAQALSDLHCPALFCTGADEPNSTPDMSRRMAQIAPRGRAEIVAGAAHMMPMTHAAQVTAILRRFLNDCAALDQGR
ncbi:MAG: alpha/beta fold hydrolase [Pseudomonadota bacterium]